MTGLHDRDVPHYLTTAEVDPDRLTPVMRQVVDAKRRHPDALVLFRLGDFYEMFFEDALEGTRLLDLALTSRNKNDPRPIPMCGFPHHALPGHVQKALEAGRRVAVCEQLEDAALAKGLVQRGVTRVITPGVVLETEALDTRLPNRVLALAPGKRGGLGLAVADVTTGELHVAEIAHPAALAVLLVRLEPREIVLPNRALPWLDPIAAARGIVRTEREVPAGVGRDPTASDAAVGLLQAYLAEVRPGSLGLLEPPRPLGISAHLELSREAVQHLEILTTSRTGRRKGSLLDAVDRTVTAAGGRLLRALLLAPLADRRALELRHAAVDALRHDRPTREALQAALRHQCDLARVATRAAACMAVPRELAALRETLATLPVIRQHLDGQTEAVALAGLHADLDGTAALLQHLQQTLADTPRTTVADGGVIRPGFDAALDELVELTTDSHAWLARFEADEREQTGITGLRVTYNRVSGYGIEIARSRSDQAPAHYHRKQTLKNAERYTTEALVAFERKLLSAESDRISREGELYRAVCSRVAQDVSLLRRVAAALAELDVHLGFAELAATQGYVRPRWVDEPALILRGSRHPVVEQMLPPGSFVPNDLALQGNPAAELGASDLEVAPAQILLVTGPNMAGKSTLMRQAALAVLLAQAGGFVPADDAVLGVHDAVLTRIGAADDIAEGASTFMVEMRETAWLLEHATPRTLVLLDEIGRGTSTYDGLSIAWAVIEALHDHARCLCLFATHYHELTALSEKLPRLRNAHVAVREWGQEIVFVHRLAPGPTNRSHGIAVARLAGLPAEVIERARRILAQLEKSAQAVQQQEEAVDRPRVTRQLSFFDLPPTEPAPTPPVDPGLLALARDLCRLDPDDLTPRQALVVVAELAARARQLPNDVRRAADDAP